MTDVTEALILLTQGVVLPYSNYRNLLSGWHLNLSFPALIDINRIINEIFDIILH